METLNQNHGTEFAKGGVADHTQVNSFPVHERDTDEQKDVTIPSKVSALYDLRYEQPGLNENE